VLAAFRKGLSETGFVEARNLVIEFRWGLGSPDRRSEAAADLSEFSDFLNPLNPFNPLNS
jgi:putative ABC transport system substrate-binding protein